jgi:hypothetical protein
MNDAAPSIHVNVDSTNAGMVWGSNPQHGSELDREKAGKRLECAVYFVTLSVHVCLIPWYFLETRPLEKIRVRTESRGGWSKDGPNSRMVLRS